MAIPKIKPMTTDEIRTLVKESGIPVAEIEQGVGMPKDTLQKSLKERSTGNGYIRTVPTKWIQPMIDFIKKRKVEKDELRVEINEVKKDLNIPVEEPEVVIPDKESKLAWIDKLQQEKNLFQ